MNKSISTAQLQAIMAEHNPTNVEQGVIFGFEEGLKEGTFLAEAVAEQHAQAEIAMCRAAMAGVMLGMLQDNADAISVTINLEAQRTVWDHFELTGEVVEGEKNYTYTLKRK